MSLAVIVDMKQQTGQIEYVNASRKGMVVKRTQLNPVVLANPVVLGLAALLTSASVHAAPSNGQSSAPSTPTIANHLSAANHASGGAPIEEMLEAVVATVDEVPITLTDVIRRLPSPRKMSLSEASRDTEFKQVLDAVVLEKLIEAEAKAKKVDTSDAEIEEYVNEVAQRNNLDRAAFESALQTEGKSMSEYKKQVRIEILKSKLISSSVRAGVSVSDAEIDKYLKENPESEILGATIKLRQVLIRTEGRSEEEAKQKVEEAKEKIESGEDFADVARALSDAPDAGEGGLIGTVAEKDLSSEIFDAVFSLDVGEISGIVKTPAGLHIFKVEDKTSGVSEDDDDETKLATRREAARKVVMDRKSQDKMSSFFVHDLYESHSVDKKI